MPKRSGNQKHLRGVVYGRQSRTKDGSGSIDQQLAACRAAADQFGVTIEHEIIEPPSTSAYKARGRARPRFPELLELVRTGAVDVVVVYKSDRLSRGGGPGWAPLWDAVDEADHGVNLDRFVLTPEGYQSEFELGIRATMDREESRKTSDRLVAMKDAHAAQGRPTGGGHRPYGYQPDTVTLDEAEAETLRDIITRYLGGEGLRSIARSLNDSGRLTSTGRQWQEATLRNLISNPRNAGLRVHRGDVVGEACWPAIIDMATWERLKLRLDAKKRGVIPGPSKYLLAGLMTCGLCGARMYGVVTEGRPRYRCSKAPGKPNCGRMTIAAAPVDEHITAALLFRLDSPAVDAAVTAPTPSPDLQGIADQIAAYETRLSEAAGMFANGEIDRKAFLDVRKEIDQQISQLRATVAANEHSVAMGAFRASDLPVSSAWQELGQPGRQELLRAVIDRIVVHPAPRRGSKVVDLDRLQVDWRA